MSIRFFFLSLASHFLMQSIIIIIIGIIIVIIPNIHLFINVISDLSIYLLSAKLD